MKLYFSLFLVSFVLCIAVIPLIIFISKKFQLYDNIDKRKIHQGQISRLGGIAIFISFVIPFLWYMSSNGTFNFNIYYYLAALFLAFGIGFVDDLITVRVRYKLVVQILCGVLVVLSDLKITDLKLYDVMTIHFGFLSNILTIIWIIIFMNAINLLDGMDGLASGIVFIANLFILILALLVNNVLVSFLSSILAGAIFGFYLFNFPPAKIFMGDGGAYFLGFIYATIPLMGIKKASVVTLFLFPIILLLIPLADIIIVMRKRFKKNVNIFLADKNHIHHRLLNLGFSKKGILFILYYFTLILGMSSILILKIQPKFTLLFLTLIFMVVFILLFLLNSAEKILEKVNKDTQVKKYTKTTRMKKTG